MRSRGKTLDAFGLHVVAPLIVGATTYVLARSLPSALRAHGADACWAYAVAAFVGLLWRDESRTARAAWQLIALVVVVFAEVGQWLHLVPGTYDSLDLLTMVAAFAAATMMVRSRTKGDTWKIERAT